VVWAGESEDAALNAVVGLTLCGIAQADSRDIRTRVAARGNLYKRKPPPGTILPGVGEEYSI
jgi:hypothetical protein